MLSTPYTSSAFKSWSKGRSTTHSTMDLINRIEDSTMDLVDLLNEKWSMKSTQRLWDDMDYLHNYLSSVTSKGYPSVVDFLKIELDEQGTTIFSHAIKHDKVNAIRCMLQFLGSEREDFLLRSNLDNNCNTPFTYAMIWNRMAVLRCMIKSIDGNKRESFLKDEMDFQGISPIIYAIKWEKKVALQCMLTTLSYTSRVTLLRSKIDDNGNTPITYAVDCNNTPALQWMLVSMAQEFDLLSLLNYKLDEKGTTHFTYALKSNVEAMGTMLCNASLIDRMSLLTRPDRQGASAVAYATQWSKRDCLLCMLDLVEEEARMTLLSNRAVFFHSVTMNNVCLVQCMLNTLDSDNRLHLLSMDDNGCAPFVYATKNNRKEMIGAMLESVDFDGRLSLLTLRTNNSYFSLPPFNHVLINDQLECFRLIMEVLRPEDRSVLLNLPIEIGSAMTCLTYACEQGRLGILLNITELGVPFQDNENGYYKVMKRNEVLHWLAKRERYTAINNLLLNLGYDQRLQLLAQTNSSGKTPHDVARSGKVKALLEWTASQDGFYYMPNPPAVLIIYNTEDRKGAEDELQNLKQILPEFNVIPVIVKNPKRADIFASIQHTIENRENTSALFVIVMSHGQKGAVEATDGPVNVNEILLQMNVQCLDGKPKVLLVQACQARPRAREDGDSSQVDTVREVDARRANPEPQIDPHFDIKHPDFMVLIASVNGGVAYRNTLVPIFSRNLSQSSQNEDLYEVFLKTHKNIREAQPEQVAEFRSTFTQKLCLRNVFNPDKVKSAPSMLSRLAAKFRGKK